MNSKNTIELNGNLYDAATGKMLGAGTAPRPKSGANIDGFFRSRTSAPVTRRTPQKISVLAPAAAPKPEPSKPRTTPNHARAHQPQVSKRVPGVIASTAKAAPASAQSKTAAPNHAKAHQPQPAVTLMRAAVKRPGPSFKKQATVQGSLTHSVPSMIPVKHTASHVDTDRLVRAGSVETSPLIAHHGKQAPARISTAVVPLHVQPAPAKPEGDTPTNAPAPAPTNKPQDIFDHALANAANFLDVKDHRSHFRKHTRKHVASMAAGTLALLVIAGFATYQNSPGLQLKVASVQAGVATDMPNFAAAGFAYNGAKATNGKLLVGFSNDRGRYQLSQQSTSWNGTDMIQSVSATDASGKPNYTTVQDGNTTIYRFSNTNATWVSGGKWYSVTGTNALTNDQVKSIVENV